MNWRGQAACGLIGLGVSTAWAGDVVKPAPEAFLLPHVLEVRFSDQGAIRLRGGRPRDTVSGGRSLADAATAGTLDRLSRRGAIWRRTHEAVPESFLDDLKRQGRRPAGTRAAPDLNLYYRLLLPGGDDPDAVAAELAALPAVAQVYRVPAPAPPPVAPDYSKPGHSATIWQRYLDAAPVGVDARHAHSNGWNGAGVRICDIEYDWNGGHADLPTPTEIGTGRTSTTWSDHGTAVLGILVGRDNTSGVRGIAYGASMYMSSPYTNYYYNVAGAITLALQTLQAGDVLLIEQQMVGPSGGSAYVPVEWYEPTYDAIRAAVLAGVTVVEAGGNGAQNLDLAIYSTGNGGHYPFLATNDSGALIVGAGAAPQAATPRSRLSFSSYGSTFDLQGFGESVVTTGYGNLYNSEGSNHWLIATFDGTSSASPIVAGAAAVLQQAWRAWHGESATPAQIRAVLRATGTAQQGAAIIGPLPDLRAALVAAAQADTDEDGLPDVWERAHYTNIGQAGDSDSDGDGFTLREEFIAGTQPTNAASRFDALTLALHAGHEITFPSATGRLYRLQYADDLLGTWQGVAGQSNVAGTGGWQSLVDSSPATTRVYRLDVRLP